MIYDIHTLSVKNTCSLYNFVDVVMIEILKLAEKVKFITIKGPQGSLRAKYLTKNLPGWPGSLTHFKPT